MENEDKTFEAYFSGKMRSAQANDFLTALDNNEVLRERYDFFLAAKKSASLIERDKMRAELADVGIKEEAPKENMPGESATPILKIVKWVASIAAVLLISFFAYNNLQTPSSQDLFAQNFETYKVQAARGGEVDALKAIYTEGDYDLFISKTLTIEKTPELNMMIANAQMSSDQFSAAISTLTRISDDSSLRDQKYWYIGLSHLKSGNNKEAIKNFDHLLSISNYKKQATEEILSNIRN